MTAKTTPEIYEEILENIRKGKSLNSICESNSRFPCNSTVHKHMNADPEYRKQYMEAKEIGCSIIADGIIDMVKAPIDIRDNIEMQHRRLIMDASKWSLSHLFPKKYGDKIDLNHGGQADNPITSIERVIVDSVKSDVNPPDFN
tara:strand:+ start:387 stop:818 length:432 start_codon:yes stop_codon:yes gene_type:complete